MSVGQDSQDAQSAMAQGPSPAVSPDQTGGQDAAQAAPAQASQAPAGAGGPVAAQPGPVTAAPAPDAIDAATQPKTGMFKNILVGALKGLAMGGIPGAVEGAISPKTTNGNWQYAQQAAQQKLQQGQSAIKFQDAQAAETYARAKNYEQQTEMAPKEFQQRIIERDTAEANDLIHQGNAPEFVVENDPDKVKTALEAYVAANGPAPGITMFHMGDKLVAFDLNKLGSNSVNLDRINEVNAVTGGPKFDNMAAFKKLPPASQTKVTNDAMSFYRPVGGSTSDATRKTLDLYQSYLDKAKMTPSLSDAASKLSGNVAMLQGLYDHQLAAEKAALQARGAAFQQAKPVQAVNENGQVVWTSAGKAIASGAAPGSVVNTLNSNYIKPANDIEQGYDLFNQAYADHLKGDQKTGAQSMLALSLHMANTFGNVKGVRVTKDMIAQHLGARGLSDNAIVAVQRLTNGDVLSPQQWTDFHSLIANARNEKWVMAQKEAARTGVNIDASLPADIKAAGSAPKWVSSDGKWQSVDRKKWTPRGAK